MPQNKIGKHPIANSVDLASFYRIVSDEKRSFAYLLSRLHNVKCPSCSCKKYYVLNRKRIRCSKCRKDYNPILDSKFAYINMPYSKWLTLVKLFELSESARSSSMQAKMSYKTALNAFHIMRNAILVETTKNAKDLKGNLESDKEYLKGRRTNISTSSAKFLYYVKEMEWRYKNKGRNLYNMIIDCMLVANRT